MKRRMKFGRCFIASEKPKVIVDKSYHKFRKIVRELFKTLHEKEPSFNEQDLNKIIKNAEKEMDEKINSFNRSQWDSVKMIDGVGVVSLAQQERQRKKRKSMKKKSGNERDSARVKKVRIAPTKIEIGKDEMKNDADTNADNGGGKEAAAKLPSRGSMKTPKASSQEKTWSHAMQDFKSVNKRRKKNMTKEEKKKLRQKRQKNNDKNSSYHQKRSSVKNPISNLMKNEMDASSIKMIQPDVGSSSISVIKGNE